MIPVSVIVVSRDRPTALRRCLRGLSQLDYPNYEIVVVADEPGLAQVDAGPFATQVKSVRFDEANISAARNLGIAAAAGEIVAFIDDDAVPEPTWLRHLASAFADDDVTAAGGYVIGRNGISFQWTARSVDSRGVATPIAIEGDRPVLLHPTPDRAIKTEGTNMAVRREVLADMGGFDPAYRFYLDETDLNMRLARKRLATAIVPLARVHHGFAESPRRRADRVPTTLFEQGASLSVFLRRHAPASTHDAARAADFSEQRKRLTRHLIDGKIEPRDMRRLLAGLRDGYRAGAERPLDSLPPLPRAAEGFRPFPTRFSGATRLLAARPWSARRQQETARQMARDGDGVTLMVFGLHARRHTVRFTDDGIWEHSGGLFGKSLRTQPPVRLWSFARRIRDEKARIEGCRGHFSN